MADWLDSFADPTQQDILRAQIQALRQRNNPEDIGRQSRAAALMGAFDAPGIQKMGGMLGQEAAQRESETTPRLSAALQNIQQGPQAALGGQTPSTFEALTKREMVPKFSVNPMTGDLYDVRTGKIIKGTGGTASLSPQALDQAAELFHTTGQLPPMGMGAAGVLTRKQIINRSAELHPDTNLAANKATYGADTESLKKLQQMSDAVDSFERTSTKNLDQFLMVAKQATDTGSPLLNQPTRWFQGKVLGDPTVSNFNTARQVAVNEIAKVLNNPGMGGAAVSDSARHEIEGLIGPDATGQQIAQAATILKTDMANRKASNAQQIGIIKGRISGAGPGQGDTSTPGAGGGVVKRFKRVPGKGLVEKGPNEP